MARESYGQRRRKILFRSHGVNGRMEDGSGDMNPLGTTLENSTASTLTEESTWATPRPLGDDIVSNRDRTTAFLLVGIAVLVAGMAWMVIWYRGRADRKNRNAAPRAGRELDEVLVDNDDSAVTVFNRGYLGDDEAHSGA